MLTEIFLTSMLLLLLLLLLSSMLLLQSHQKKAIMDQSHFLHPVETKPTDRQFVFLTGFSRANDLHRLLFLPRLALNMHILKFIGCGRFLRERLLFFKLLGL